MNFSFHLPFCRIAFQYLNIYKSLNINFYDLSVPDKNLSQKNDGRTNFLGKVLQQKIIVCKKVKYE